MSSLPERAVLTSARDAARLTDAPLAACRVGRSGLHGAPARDGHRRSRASRRGSDVRSRHWGRSFARGRSRRARDATAGDAVRVRCARLAGRLFGGARSDVAAGALSLPGRSGGPLRRASIVTAHTRGRSDRDRAHACDARQRSAWARRHSPRRVRSIRPFLEVRRAALEAYARAEGVAWVDDPSNSSRRFLRNRLRHEILPALRSVDPYDRRRLCSIRRRGQRAGEPTSKRFVDAQCSRGDWRASTLVVAAIGTCGL